ncbi:capsid protein [Dissostichus eleginoides]|uniref:Capsid protein n=1 Tax=Dissostichus eleginoides TaxID=100907 RepID=A0AAD9BE41_DISEL|nr:capsid protein [Dissostichus eleginoides]
MGEVEVSVCEKGAPEVQHYDLRSSLRSMRPQGLQRHLVVQSPNCSSLFPEEEAEFNRGLKYSFILVLTWAVIM